MFGRNQDLADRIGRAESDLLEFKSAQTFGRDVTTPKVIERYNADGTPTTWDVMAVGEYDGFATSYRVAGQITYRSDSQESPWATVYAKLMVNPQGVIKSTDNMSFSAYRDIDDVFNGNRTIRFYFSGATDNQSGTTATRDETIDRLYVKIYVLATDYGSVNVEIPKGFFANGYVGKGNLVPLT